MKLGLKKIGDPDIETIRRTPYPVLSRYGIWRQRLGYDDMTSLKITSGYRDEIIDGNQESPHHYGFAIDVVIGDMLKAADAARDLFARIGFYPGRSFLHLDQAPDNWIKHHCKARYWVNIRGIYRVFEVYETARACAESEVT